MKLKYPVHFEVSRYGFYEIEHLTSKGEFRPACGMSAGKPKAFRSHKQAIAAGKRHKASVIAFWLEDGKREYNHCTLYGPRLITDNFKFIPGNIKSLFTNPHKPKP